MEAKQDLQQLRDLFFEQGYLLLKGVLSTEEITVFQKLSDHLELSGQLHSQNDSGTAFKLVHVVEHTSEFDYLLDHKAVFPLLLELMGPFIQVMGTEFFYRRPGRGMSISWHTDGGPYLGRFRFDPNNPVLHLKAQYFLTDLSRPDQGNFMFIPKSHLIPVPAEGLDHKPPTQEPVQILAEAGDVLLFPWSLWHGVSPNHGTRVRKSLTIRYGQAWCRPYDYHEISKVCLERLSPRQRLLFGYMGAETLPYNYYYPDTQFIERTMQNDPS